MSCISVIAYRSRYQIERDLSRVAPLSLVVGSQMLEDGIELIVEGPLYELEALVDYWADDWQQLELPIVWDTGTDRLDMEEIPF